MTTTWKIAIVLAVILSVGSAVVSLQKPDVLGGNTLGALGVKLIENYSPYVRYNGGTYTALPIQTTSTLASGALSATSGAFSSTLSATATTTLSDTVNFYNPAICINFYATSTATVNHMVASTTATIEGVDGVMMFGYGACAN